MIEKMKESFVSLLYPRRCPVCDGIVTGESLIHPKCKKSIKIVKGSTCLKCGKPIKDETAEFCSDCSKTRHIFDRGYALCRYRSVSGSVYRFKYSERREYADFYGEEIAEYLGETIKTLKPDALIPVPMYRKKERIRGYNQATILAKAIGKRLGISVRDDLVVRCKNTVPMKLLDENQRKANLKKAFNIAQNEVKYKCIILIDDIYTTGATLDAVAKVFRDKGVKKIYFVTLAIGQVV